MPPSQVEFVVRRLIKFKDDHLRYLKDFDVPFSNSTAERSFRILKSRQKISGRFVSVKGGETYLGGLSILKTSKANNQNSLKAIEAVFNSFLKFGEQ